jgi:hypothetical protein
MFSVLVDYFLVGRGRVVVVVPLLLTTQEDVGVEEEDVGVEDIKILKRMKLLLIQFQTHLELNQNYLFVNHLVPCHSIPPHASKY